VKRLVQPVAELDALLMQAERMFAIWFSLACSADAVTVVAAAPPVRVTDERVCPVERLTMFETVLKALASPS